MKPLILILLFTVSAQSQSLVEAARKAREQKAAQKAARVYTSDDAKSAGQGQPDQKPAETPATKPAGTPAAKAPGAAPAAAAAAAKAAADDPVKKYNEQVLKLRARI